MQTDQLIQKINSLPPDKLAEVEDFVDFIAQRSLHNKRQLRHEAIVAYATQHAGTDADIDAEIEQAAVEHLLAEEGREG